LDVLRVLENDSTTSASAADNFTESSLKKMLNQLEKRVNKNQEMRIKFSDQPDKFMDSEMELNDIINEMHICSTRQDLYPIILQTNNTINLLIQLLNHENIDIAVACISLLQELTDIDSSPESFENIKLLIDSLTSGNEIFSVLESNLQRLDEKNSKDEAEAVHNIMAIIENIIEVEPTISLNTDSKAGILKWLLKRIRVKQPAGSISFDENKLYAGELLSILVQNQEENSRLLGDEFNGIDVLLQQLAFYKKHDPASADEYEYMENIFNCLCSCLMLSENRSKFLKSEGLQLMRLILREQKNARTSALKVLTYAMNNLNGKESCEAFVEMLGLGVLFPLFMKPVITGSASLSTMSAAKRKKLEKESLNNEEHIVSIIASLLKNCSGFSKQRVLMKFVENDYEKTDRIMELFLKYLEEVQRVDKLIEAERKRSQNNKDSDEDDDDDDDEKENEYYMKRLEGGLFALQSIVYIILDISQTPITLIDDNNKNSNESTSNETIKIKKRILKHLKMRNISNDVLIKIIKGIIYFRFDSIQF
jgi:beta-catenin-like protein 1